MYVLIFIYNGNNLSSDPLELSDQREAWFHFVFVVFDTLSNKLKATGNSV